VTEIRRLAEERAASFGCFRAELRYLAGNTAYMCRVTLFTTS
jgi:hypothetical protein